MVSIRDLASAIIDLLADNTDSVIIHSSLLQIGRPLEGVDALRDILVYELVEKRGLNLIIPTFSFNQNLTWDPGLLTNDCGVLSKAFIKKYSCYRTIHPIHSVVHIPPRLVLRNSFSRKAVSESSFGPKSIWHKLAVSDNTLNIGLGIGLDGGGTYLHAFEEIYQVPYRKLVDINSERISPKLRNYQFSYFARTNIFINGEEVEFYNDWNKVMEEMQTQNLYHEKTYPDFLISSSIPGKVHSFVRKKLMTDPFFMAKPVTP